MPNNLPYAASKGAAEALTLSISARLLARASRLMRLIQGRQIPGWLSDDLRMKLRQRAPFGRIGSVDDAESYSILLPSEAQW